MKTKHLLYILPLAALTACEPDIDELSFSNGSADFSTMVAVGNSLTAGYQSGALSADGQINSLPAMIAGQMKQVGGGEFRQPILTGELATKGAGVSPLLVPSGKVETRLALKGTVDCLMEVGLGPVRKGDDYLGLAALSADVSGETYNNQGVPGAKLIDLDNPLFPNPYFARIRPLGKTMLTLATDVNATFFSLWIGNNDVLGYATAGGDEAIVVPGLIPKPELTDAGVFDTKYNAAITALTASGAKGVVANIPNVTSIPYFTTVPIGTNAVDATGAAGLNGFVYKAHNDSVASALANGAITQTEAARRTIKFTGGQINTFVITDNSLTDLSAYNVRKIRHAVPGELMTLTTPGDSLRCAGWGTQKPIPGNYHLGLNEIQKINDATSSYNNTIKAAAQANGLAFVDANARLKELATTGIIADGISFSSALVTGGAFSLDGVHPSTRGYAIIANDFISAINSTYSASIPKVNVGSYSTIEVEQ